MSVALKPELHQQHSLRQSRASLVVIGGITLVVLKGTLTLELYR